MSEQTEQNSQGGVGYCDACGRGDCPGEGGSCRVYGPHPAARAHAHEVAREIGAHSDLYLTTDAAIVATHDPALPMRDRSVNVGWVLDRLTACDLVTPNGRMVRDMLIRHLERELGSA